VYYKRGVGIVHIIVAEGVSKKYCSLKKHTIVSGLGGGLIPFCEGNRWEYASDFSSDAESVYEVISCNGSEAMVAAHRLGITTYSPDNWDDMILQMRRGYCTKGDNQKLQDVSFQIERAFNLADTKYRKSHTKIAADVMKRIFEGDKDYTPEGRFTGHWNFFNCETVSSKNGKIMIRDNRNYSFEWKNMSKTGNAGEPLLVNDILGIINDVAGCIWCDDWCDGAAVTVSCVDYLKSDTSLTVEGLDFVEVAAGRFNDCLKINLDIKGSASGSLKYRTGKKVYYYARGIGIVKCVHYLKEGAVTATYELTAYEGTGDGYMPIKQGMFRCYEAIGLTDGYVGKAEYTFCEENGWIIILENRTGIRMK